MDATDIRRSPKRTADSAGLNEDGEGVQGLEKARGEGQYAGMLSPETQTGRRKQAKGSICGRQIGNPSIRINAAVKQL